MKSWKKVSLLGVSALALFSLAACGSSEGDKTSESSTKPAEVKGDLTLWVDPANVDSYKALTAEFTKKYPDAKVKVVQSPTGSANAKTDVGKDPTKAADVFKVPNDQLGAMAEAGYINPLSPDATKWVKENDVEDAAKAVSWQDKFYAYPQDQQSNVIFYNKAKFSEAPKSWDQFTKDKAIGTDFTNSYNWYPAFLSNGTTLYGSDGEDLKGTDVAGDKGVEVLKWFAKQKSNTGVVQSGSALLADLKSGKTAAILDGPWDAGNVKKILGDNYGVTTLPEIDFGSGAKKMQAFSGVGTLAVNASSKNQVAAAALAQFLSDENAQKELYKANNAIPVAKGLQEDKDITKDEAAVAVMAQVKEDTLMPKMPEMATFWNLAAPLINNTYLGKIQESQFDTQLKTFQDAISKEVK